MTNLIENIFQQISMFVQIIEQTIQKITTRDHRTDRLFVRMLKRTGQPQGRMELTPSQLLDGLRSVVGVQLSDPEFSHLLACQGITHILFHMNTFLHSNVNTDLPIFSHKYIRININCLYLYV